MRCALGGRAVHAPCAGAGAVHAPGAQEWLGLTLVTRRVHINTPVGAMVLSGTALGTTDLEYPFWKNI